QPRHAPDLQVAQFAVTNVAVRLRSRAGCAETAEVDEVREPRRDRGARPARATRHEVAERLDTTHDDADGYEPEQRGERVRREQPADAASRERGLIRTVESRAVVGCFAMRDARVGRDDHPRAREARAPAEVEVLRARERRGVETLELVEEVDADE